MNATELPVRMPFVVRALDGETEVDAVRADEVITLDDGFRVTGHGRRFDAEATWAREGGGWQVALDVRLGEGPPVAAGLVVAVRLARTDDPHWLIPGLFYGPNRGPGSAAPYPHWTAAGDGEWASTGWSFRADRAAVPLVFARDRQRGIVLSTAGEGPLGLNGLGFGLEDGVPELRLCFPYREEPVGYDGSSTPLPPDRPAPTWREGDRVRLAFRVEVTTPEPFAWVPALRARHAALAATSPLSPWLDVPAAAALAAEGLRRWHYRPEPPVLIETAAFERRGHGEADEPGDRLAMHVGWVSGTPSAAALLAHGRRTGDGASANVARAVLDHIAGNLAPCGTFWGQWTADRGWTKGWTPGEDRLHARTLGEATLFLVRAAAAEPAGASDAWLAAIRSNLEFVAARQRDDGAIPASWNGRTGEPASWAGTAGLAWVPALVEGARLLDHGGWLDAARRAGEWYASFVDDELLYGAPEDVDLGPTSEDGYVATMAYVALARSEPEPSARDRWIELARRAADWSLTFRYAWNVRFDADTTLGRLDFRTRGADQASPANQHLHAYGLVCLPELARLTALTGDPHYLERAREHLACYRQLIARRDGDFGARRGMAPERAYQTACFGPKGEIGRLSHAWCLGLLLWACEAAIGVPELAEAAAA